MNSTSITPSRRFSKIYLGKTTWVLVGTDQQPIQLRAKRRNVIIHCTWKSHALAHMDQFDRRRKQVIFVALVVVSVAAPAEPSKIIRSEFDQSPEGGYNLYYSYINDQGKQELINYQATEDGFKAQGNSIPKAPVAIR
ncbi:unnamed protein product [Arctia plantaginis]|uniref:Uncharacterized protein n=1 Tax=Arctia plantaginis TaxID=874455 RepID=A0A8S0YQD2_ARCPL|nr:unnamed protein product [Arctia plantaginis]